MKRKFFKKRGRKNKNNQQVFEGYQNKRTKKVRTKSRGNLQTKEKRKSKRNKK